MERVTMLTGQMYIVMVGLPARGKTTIAFKLKENLSKNGIATRIFNNGQLRRQMLKGDSSNPEFFDPDNKKGIQIRERIASINIQRAQTFLEQGGDVAILDATNHRHDRRLKILELLSDHPILFVECLNKDEEILQASILRKIVRPEFSHMDKEQAVNNFYERIRHYEGVYASLDDVPNFVKLDSLNNQVLHEEITDKVPYYDLIRDLLVSDSVKNLFLIRHGETFFNLENRLGGDSALTDKGRKQAAKLAMYFRNKRIPVIFTSDKHRTMQTAEPIREQQKDCTIIPLSEFNEIDAGVCEGMSYEEVRIKMPAVYFQRKLDKYNYTYPQGEGYVSMKDRIRRGIKKALYLSTNSNNVMIVGHQAVNRMILSHFLYRRTEDVPYIYIPQDKFYHIVALQDKKLFQLKKY